MTSCGNERRPSRRDEVKGEDDNKNDEERTAMNSRYNDYNKKIEQYLLVLFTAPIVSYNVTICI